MADRFNVGDVIRMKKPRLKCQGCGHQIMVARRLVEKNTKEIKKKS